MGFLGREILDFTLTRKLGEGGAAVVYLGEHAELGTRCVFKILHPELGRSPDLMVRFHAGAAALLRFEHPAVPRLMNLGRLTEGELFYQIEHVTGIDLKARIAAGGPLALDRLGPTFEPVSAALAAAHDRGLVHGGIKPGNVMLDERRDGSVEARLLDLGILTGIDAASSSPRVAQCVGSLTFAAPEQLREGHSADPRTDVYGFAATIYAAAVGAAPVAAGEAEAGQPGGPPLLHWAAPGASRALEVALGRCLDPDPDRRPQTIAGAWSSIRDALESRTGARRGAPRVPRDRSRWRRRGRGALYVIAFILAALAGLALAWLLA